MSFLHVLIDPSVIVRTAGLVGVFGIIFAESGIFFGFFLPGDSLLFTAGFLASQGFVPIVWLLLVIFIASVLGYHVGYIFGRRVGTTLFTKDHSIFFNKKYPEQAGRFYEKYGPRAVMFARFIPIVRTFAPIMAGVGSMDYGTFSFYNVAGGAMWTVIMTSAGIFLGKAVPRGSNYIELIIIGIVLLSCIPPLYHFFKERML